MPIEKATTVHTTIQGTQFNNFKSVFVTDTSAQNATAGCGTGNSGLAFWTVFNSTLGSSATVTTTTFKLTIDGVTDDGDEIDITLGGNQTAASGIVSFAGATAKDIIIGAAAEAVATGHEEVGDILLSVQCQSGDTAAASGEAP